MPSTLNLNFEFKLNVKYFSPTKLWFDVSFALKNPAKSPKNKIFGKYKNNNLNLIHQNKIKIK